MWDRLLSIILIIIIMGALGSLGYIIATPGVGEGFTELYILGLSGEVADYPEELKVGEVGEVTAVIVNYEREVVSYGIEVRIDGVNNNQVEAITLEHGEEQEVIVSFTPHIAGDSQKVEFLLYKDGDAEPYFEPVYLLVNVTE